MLFLALVSVLSNDCSKFPLRDKASDLRTALFFLFFNQSLVSLIRPRWSVFLDRAFGRHKAPHAACASASCGVGAEAPGRRCFWLLHHPLHGFSESFYFYFSVLTALIKSSSCCAIIKQEVGRIGSISVIWRLSHRDGPFPVLEGRIQAGFSVLPG